MGPSGLRQKEIAERLGMSCVRGDELANGKRGVTPDTALRLARLSGNTPESRLHGQRNIDLWKAMHSPEAKGIEGIDPIVA